LLIPRHILREFFRPKMDIRFGCRSNFAARMAVPKAAMDEDNRAVPRMSTAPVSLAIRPRKTPTPNHQFDGGSSQVANAPIASR